MRVLADECIDSFLIICLREAGHDVSAIVEGSPGTPDHTVLELSVDESRILVTEDYDFGELVIRFKRKAFGIVTIAPSVADDTSIEAFRLLVKRISELDVQLIGQLTTLEKNRTRQRALPQI